jgi:hypothetical protein
MIDIEKLAREAGFGNYASEARSIFERFAALVLEEAAKCCDDAKPSGGRMWTDKQAACFDCLTYVSDAIRALKDKK